MLFDQSGRNVVLSPVRAVPGIVQAVVSAVARQNPSKTLSLLAPQHKLQDHRREVQRCDLVGA